MKVLSVGGGAREHAMVEALVRSGAEVYSVMKNRNPGIARLSEDCHHMDECDVDKVGEWAQDRGVELAVVGPEAPLGAGIADELERLEIPCAAPSEEAAQIEISKEFMRELMEKHGIQGAVEFGVYDSIDGVKGFLDRHGEEVVVKPVGLTGGKGVRIFGEHMHSREDVLEYAGEVINKSIGGSAKVVMERCLYGEEFTLQCFCDGSRAVPMPAVQDHKRAYEGDEGPNTGGMGSYSQEDGLLPFLTRERYKEATDIVNQTVKAMKAEGHPFKGFLYGQFMLTRDGPRVIEFNARFGDPEAMNVLPLLSGSFTDICAKIAEGSLGESEVTFDRKATVCKYVVPAGYGVKSEVGARIDVDEEAIGGTGAKLYYASVNEEEGTVYTTSSRSLAVLGIDDSLEDAEKMAESALAHVKGNVSMRHDIGKRETIERKLMHMAKVLGAGSD